MLTFQAFQDVFLVLVQKGNETFIFCKNEVDFLRRALNSNFFTCIEVLDWIHSVYVLCIRNLIVQGSEKMNIHQNILFLITVFLANYIFDLLLQESVTW